MTAIKGFAIWDRWLWGAFVALAISVGFVISRLHHGYPVRGDWLLAVAAVVAIVAINGLYARLSWLARDEPSWLR